MKNLITILLIFNIYDSVVYSQESRDKEFIKLISHISGLFDYKDKVIIQKENKKKLIVSDFKIQPVLKKTIETDSFIIISNAEILKYHVQNYINPTKLLISKDSSYIEFEIISTKNDKLKGFLSLFRDKAGQEDRIVFGTEMIDKKILK